MSSCYTPTSAKELSSTDGTHNVLYVFSISMIASMGGLMFGFDLGIITGVIRFIEPQFSLGKIQLGWVVAIFELGCMFGAFGVSRFADKYGRLRTMQANATLLIISSVGIPFAFGAVDLSIWRFVQGISVGAASVLSPMYIAEISPAASRGRYIALNQLSIIFGILLATVSAWFFSEKNPVNEILYLMQSQDWRWMLGSALVPSVAFLGLLFLLPETPRWLVKAKRDSDAEKVLKKIGGPNHLAEIKQTLSATHSHCRYRDLLAPGLFTALMIGVGLAVLQQFCGANNVTTYVQVIFEKAQIPLGDGLFKGMFVGLVFFVFTFVAIATIDRLGRRKLMLMGTSLMAIVLFGLAWAFNQISVLEAAKQDVTSTGRIVFILVLAYIATFAFTLGPVTWVLLAEIFPNFIREKALSIASCALWTATFVVVLITPFLLEFSATFNFILFALLNVIGFIAVWKWLPETNGLTLEEMDHLWIKK